MSLKYQRIRFYRSPESTVRELLRMLVSGAAQLTGADCDALPPLMTSLPSSADGFGHMAPILGNPGEWEKSRWSSLLLSELRGNG